MSIRTLAGGVAAAALIASPVIAAPTAEAAAIPAKYKNCTAVHKTYKHGVGRKGAHDRTRSRRNPVTNFKVSTAIYKAAIRANKRLDADKDGIACETH